MAFSSLTTLHTHLFPHTTRLPRPARATNLPKNPRPRAFGFLRSTRLHSFRIDCKAKTGKQENETEGRPFDINLAVVLAGFAFEAYTSPPENVGRKELDAADCKTVYLSESFVREIYDGQLFVKLKKGQKLPAMDPWGTSDPYVVMELDSQVAKSKVKWGTKEPTWNEEFIFNIKQHSTTSLQVAAWDANLVTPHKRMGNTCVHLEYLCDGSLHEVLVELEGMGGGGTLHLEVKYKSFDEIDGEKMWWRIPFVEEFLRKNGFESAVNMLVGSKSVPARQFVEYAFGQLNSFNDVNLWKDRLVSKKNDADDIEKRIKSEVGSEMPSQFDVSPEHSVYSSSSNVKSELERVNGNEITNKPLSDPATPDGNSMQPEKHFWQDLTGIINESVAQKLGVPLPENLKWDGFDLLNKIGLQFRDIAEAAYIESGLAVPEVRDINNETATAINAIQQSLPDIKKTTQDVIRQTESVFGTLMVLTAAVSQLSKEASGAKKQENEDILPKEETDVSSSKVELHTSTENGSMLDNKKAEEMKRLFSTAESAMEAWAMLATSVGHSSFIKSEFEKLCFLDNSSTDTQVAIWRDSTRKRLIVAFRGTEQTRWKDLITDLMLAPAGLNPERIGGDFKQEVQVHTGFLTAYDSVRIRIISLIKQSIGYIDDCTQLQHTWHIYVTGHSLGGALATLLALELSSSQMAKHGAIFVTMYNFGSPRVGNKRFADVYNEKVKDSWRIVNHRDIIPTIPRLMGYCHVAQPVYLAGGFAGSMVNMELLGDGYQGDVIGESTPDVLVTEFMKGETELIEKILQTEINIFRSIRDGSALMQHMEDFYYISLLESVRSNYQTSSTSQSNTEGGIQSA